MKKPIFNYEERESMKRDTTYSALLVFRLACFKLYREARKEVDFLKWHLYKKRRLDKTIIGKTVYKEKQ